jgi:hypothetical protein
MSLKMKGYIQREEREPLAGSKQEVKRYASIPNLIALDSSNNSIRRASQQLSPLDLSAFTPISLQE